MKPLEVQLCQKFKVLKDSHFKSVIYTNGKSLGTTEDILNRGQSKYDYVKSQKYRYRLTFDLYRFLVETASYNRLVSPHSLKNRQICRSTWVLFSALRSLVKKHHECSKVGNGLTPST